MVKFKAILEKFGKKGEKTGWTYIVIRSEITRKLKPGFKRSFKVKGKLDDHAIKGVNLLPMGEGDYIMAINAAMRKGIRKQKGETVVVELEEDKSKDIISPDLMACLEEDKPALKFFQSLTGSHQRYFSKWIESAKTDATKAKRIAMSVNAFQKKMGYPEMLRAAKANKES
jgi:hypothetical protein